jgi:hypothetical protein
LRDDGRGGRYQHGEYQLDQHGEYQHDQLDEY